MIFFFSFVTSLLGGISHILPFSMEFQLNVNNPFSGIIFFWPFIIVLLVILMAIMWYQTIAGISKSKASASVRHSGGMRKISFLSILTVFVLLVIATPYYLRSLEERRSEKVMISENRIEMLITVHGMDCSGCEGLVNRKVGQLKGVDTVVASHVRENVFVVYDKSLVTLDEIIQQIESSGYTAVLD